MPNIVAKTEQELTAYWQGFGAHRDGKDRDENPYKGPVNEAAIREDQLAVRALFECWFTGWIDARIEASRTKGKKLRGSKTFWFGVGLVLLSVLTFTAGLEIVAGNPALASLVTGAAGFTVIILRLISKQAIDVPFVKG